MREIKSVHISAEAMTVKVEMNQAEAELFKRFREYQDVWAKVFQIKGGKATLHFDAFGTMRKVEYSNQDIL